MSNDISYINTLPTSAVRIICKVFKDDESGTVYPEMFSSYTCENTSFNFSLSWNEAFADRNFYSNKIIIWDLGDGVKKTDPEIKHFYKNPNIYEVNATVFDKNGEAYLISLKTPLTAKNIFPDYLYIHPLDELGRPYNLPSGKRSNQIFVSRYNSWQNEQTLKENNYTINLYVSGSKSDHYTLSSYYSNKYSHLKSFHGFVNLSIDSNNKIQSKIVESTLTNSVSVYAIPYTTGMLDGDWDIKFNFYNYEKEGSNFIGSSGTNYGFNNVYFIDQKPSNTSIDIIYATFDSKNIVDHTLNNENINIFKKYDQGYLNLPSSAQLVKSIFNPAQKIRITSNGISPEGVNTTIGNLSGQFLYPFDIYPIKWTNSKIPFVINFKDNENFNVKNYPPIYDFHTGDFNSKLNDVNLKLLKFVNIDPLSPYSELSSVEIKDARFYKNPSVPQYDDAPYFGGILECSEETKIVAISATVMIQDSPVSKIYPIYAFLSQIGLNKIKRYDKIANFSYCNTKDLTFYYDEENTTFTNSSTANVHISFCPLKFLDNSKENRVFILDADEDKIYRSDIDGNIISVMDLSLLDYYEDLTQAPVKRSFIGDKKSASPSYCSTDRDGNLYVSLTDNISAIKIDYETDIVSRIYVPDMENIEIYEGNFYTRNIGSIKNRYENEIIRVNDRTYGFSGENIISPGSIDVDSENNVYVAYTHPLSNFVCKFNNNGDHIDTYYFNKLEVPQEIIIDGNDDLWVGIENINKSSTINEDRSDIVYFIDNETREKTIIRNIDGFGMMTIDKDQNLYVLNKTNTITRIDGTYKTKKDYFFGKSIEENPYLKDIGAIAVDSSGELWAVNNVDGKIYFADTNNMNVPLSSLNTTDLTDLGLTVMNGLGSIYFVTGDWTGFRWMNKFIKTEIPKPRIISGLSTYFDINKPQPTVIKKGEDFNQLNQLKSYVAQESLFDKDILWNEFMGKILGKGENVYEIGKVVYEKIDNFVSNNIDIETCNIDKLFSLADQTGEDIGKYKYNYPPSIKRSMDLVSISQRKLFGTANSYNRNFPTSNEIYSENKNLGDEIKIKDGTFIAGKPIVSFELFSEKYELITNTLIQNSNYGDIIALSGINYNWGWGLVTASREQMGEEITKYYKFYKHVDNKSIEIYDNIIDFDSEMTTLTPHQSSFDDWSKYGGFMDKILSYGLYSGLKMIK
jgi:hypothetical protein